MPVRNYRVTDSFGYDSLIAVGKSIRGVRFMDIERLRYDADEKEKEWYLRNLVPALRRDKCTHL